MAIAIVISEAGTMERADLSDYTDYRDAVQGGIEYVYLRDDVGAYVNDEGRYTMEDNPKGSNALAFLMGPERGLAWARFNGPVQGPVVLIGPADDEGETMDLPGWVFEALGV